MKDQNTPTNTLEEQDLIDELEQIEAIISPDSVMAPDKIDVLSRYIKTRLNQLTKEKTV